MVPVWKLGHKPGKSDFIVAVQSAVRGKLSAHLKSVQVIVLCFVLIFFNKTNGS